MRYAFQTNELEDKKGTHMKRLNGTQRVLPLAVSALAFSPIIAMWTTDSTSAATVKAATSHTYKGPMEYVDHGPVQVSIVVTNKKITGVKVANAPQGGRSVFLQNQAIPILRQETLRAQSAAINEVSGATDTSGGYIASLQAAIKTARQHRSLK